MVCVKCSAAADLEEAALHDGCPGGTWCPCQHRQLPRPAKLVTTASGRAMCTCQGPELPHRPQLCDIVRARVAVNAARAALAAVRTATR